MPMIVVMEACLINGEIHEVNSEIEVDQATAKLLVLMGRAAYPPAPEADPEPPAPAPTRKTRTVNPTPSED
jgi:hypothetical protein